MEVSYMMLSLVLLAVGLGQVHADDWMTDPCDRKYHVEVNDTRRSTGYQTGPDDTPLCDIHMGSGWYRFMSAAGGVMPTYCPKRLSCGTVVPVWMNGSHPSVQDGIVERQVCANFGDNCCKASASITVKNCGSYFVYYLFPTQACPISYCAGDKYACPEGQTSPTGLSPCTLIYPNLTKDPILSGPHLDLNSSSFNFDCVLDFPELDPRQRFDVVWTFDGKEDPLVQFQVSKDPYRRFVLEGKYLKNHMNSHIQCKIRAYYHGESRKSDFRSSSQYFAGIQTDPQTLSILEKDSLKKMTLTSTLPVVCENKTDCCLMLKLNVQSSARELALKDTCMPRLCTHHWDDQKKKATIDIPYLAVRDKVSEGRTRTLIDFDSLLPSGGGEYANIFTGYNPDPVPVTVDDSRTFTCVISGDPHIRQVDARHRIDVYSLGTYTAYRSVSRNFEVQIRTWSCLNRPVACVCGVSVREGNDLVKINQCDQNRYGNVSPDITVARPLRHGTRIKRSRDGSTIEVRLFSGSVVKVRSWPRHMLVKISTPGQDMSKASGLCGTTDGSPNNDLTRPDGVVELPCSPGNEGCRTEHFSRSWRTHFGDNLFEQVPGEVATASDYSSYCTCSRKRSVTMPNGVCSYRGHLSRHLGDCHDCPDVTSRVRPVNIPSGQWSKRDGPVFEDTDLPDVPYVEPDLAADGPDLNFTWPNDQGMTKHEALVACGKAVEGASLWSECSAMSEMVDNTLNDCVDDILYGGSTDFLVAATLTFTELCHAHLVQDIKNYNVDSDDEITLKPEYDSELCSPGCFEHGHCSRQTRGVCVCDIGWSGSNCHIRSGVNMQLDRIRSGPLCDLSQRPCRKVFIDASNFDLTTKLVCAVKLIEEIGNKTVTRKIELTQADYISAAKIACEIPETGNDSMIGWNQPAASTHFMISASFDGFTFGNELALHVFDGSCLDCSGAGCTLKPDTCHIEGYCHKIGTVAVHDEAKICEPSINTTDWTNIHQVTKTTSSSIISVNPSIRGPSSDNKLNCDFNIDGGDATGSDVTVTWMVNDQVENVKVVPAGTTTDAEDVHNFFKGGSIEVVCRVMVRGVTGESGALSIV